MRTLKILFWILVIYGIFGRQPIYTSSIAQANIQRKNEAIASWYGLETCEGKKICKMADGKVFDPNAFTVACASHFPLGSKFRFYYEDKMAEAKCQDRGGFEKFNNGQRLFDFSKGLFQFFAPLRKGIIKIAYEKLE